MKNYLLTGMLLALSALVDTHAALYSAGDVTVSGVSSGGAPLNLAIPDANPFGATSSIMVSGAGSSLTTLTVTTQCRRRIQWRSVCLFELQWNHGDVVESRRDWFR